MQTNNILRYVVLGGIFLVPFVFLIVSESLFFPFITGKGFVFRVIVEIVFGTWLILALRDRSYMPSFSKLTIALISFTGIVLIADLAGMNPVKSLWSNYERMEGFVVMAHLLGYYLVASSVLTTEKLWDKFMHTAFGVGLFISFYAFLQKIGEIKINQGDTRLDATLGNSIYLAVTMLFLIFFGVLWFIRNRTNISNILYSWILGLGLFIAYPFYAYYQKFSEIQDYYGKNVIPQEVKDRVFFWAGQTQAGVTTGLWQPILFWLAIVLFIVAVYTYAKSSKLSSSLHKWTAHILYGLLIVINVVVLFNTGTRGTIIALMGGAFLTAIIIALFEKHRPLVRKSAIGVMVIIPLLVGAFYMVRTSHFVTSHQMIARYALIFTYENKTQARGYVWPMAIDGFKEKPILGWGQENFSYVFNKNYDPRMYAHEQWFDRAHNVFLDWLIAGGILAFLGYVSLYGIVLYFLWRKREVHFSVVDKAILTGLLGAYAVHNVFVFDNLVSYILFFSFLAYIHTLSHPPKNETLVNFELEKGIVESIIAPIVIIATIFAIYIINWNAYFAGQTLIDALQQRSGSPTKTLELFNQVFEYDSFGSNEAREQLSMATGQMLGKNVDPAIQQKFLTLVRKQIDEQLKEAPFDARAYVFAGAFFSQIGLAGESEKYLEDAYKLSPNKQSIIIQLGENKMNLGKIDEAVTLFKKAYELETTQEQARNIYISVLVYAKQEKEAERILMESYGTTVIPDERLLQAYINTNNFKKALPIVELLIEKEPRNVKHHFALGIILYKLGQTTKAIAELDLIVKMEPSTKGQIDEYIKLMKAGKSIQ